MPVVDETVSVIRDKDWQYIRVPLSIPLPDPEVRLHQDMEDGPITLSAPRPQLTKELRSEGLRKVFAEFDAALAAGETFEIERDFCSPRDVNL